MSVAHKFTKQERLERASLRVAMVMRGMWEERGASHSRLVESPLIEGELVTVGRSKACGDRTRREHIIPCVIVVRECHRMLEKGVSDAEIAAFIREHVKIVHVAPEEAARLDGALHTGLRQKMPSGWVFGDDPYSRLVAAGIEWEPVAEIDGESELIVADLGSEAPVLHEPA